TMCTPRALCSRLLPSSLCPRRAPSPPLFPYTPLFRSLDRAGANTVVEFVTSNGRAVVGKGASGPGQEEFLAEAVRPETAVRTVGANPRVEAESFEFTDRAGGEPVTARLVAWEDRGVGEEYVGAVGGGPRRGSSTRRSGAHDEHIGGGGVAH